MPWLKHYFIFLLLTLSFEALTKIPAPLEKQSLIILAPPVINKDYFLLEYGFVVKKEIKEYFYNAFVTIALFEESADRPDNLAAGALGFKAGIYLPLSDNLPISLKMATGFARSVLHPKPFFGKDEQSASKNSLVLVEIGLQYKKDDFVIGLNYHRNTIDYFTKKVFLSFGVNY